VCCFQVLFFSALRIQQSTERQAFPSLAADFSKSVSLSQQALEAKHNIRFHAGDKPSHPKGEKQHLLRTKRYCRARGSAGMDCKDRVLAYQNKIHNRTIVSIQRSVF
jgi:hypothetical protein